MAADSWLIRTLPAPSPDIVTAVGGSNLVAQLLQQRGIQSYQAARAFIDPKQYNPAPPTALPGVAEGAQLLHKAIRAKSKILVWGDFDVDGQTSTSLLVAALRRLTGKDHVHFHIPNRLAEGHGILPAKLREMLESPDFRPDLILTCDTGIAEGSAIGYAKDSGLIVIVTDHHDLPPELAGLDLANKPIWGVSASASAIDSVRRADAIINPKFLSSTDPLRTLPGVGVAFKLIQELYTLVGRSGQENDLLDLVALGIVADVSEQIHDARYLLQLGLER
jgi:single-stranded-DNA-specific exonuclease